jgi:transcription elongation GreA/GreB family factor
MLTPPKRRWHKIPSLDDNGAIPLTPQAHARLKERLTRIKASIPALAAEAGRTADYGDRSDNAEYKEAKSQLRRANGNVIRIEEQLKRVVEIGNGTNAGGGAGAGFGSADGVQLGSTVVLALLDPNNKADDAKNIRQVTFRILGPYETDPGAGRISHKSPLGAALIGRAKGDVVTIKTELGERKYKILEIK